MNSRFDNNEADVIWEAIAADVKLGVEFLRTTAGARKVILFGHSGGAATLSFYQAVAENGIGFCNNPQKLTVCGRELADLPRADGLILADASSGNPVGLLRSLNPAVVTEGDPKGLDPSLDPFSRANGFNPDGPSSYPAEFRQRYYAAQSARMNRLVEHGLAQARQLGTDRATFPDDNVFLIVRAFGARLPESDVETGSAQPRKLLKNNGSIVTEVIRTVRPPSRMNPSANATFNEGARLLTLRSFLTTNAIRSTSSMDGVDWCSSNNSTPCALGQISVPLLVSAMGAGTAIRDNERLYEGAASRDKDFFVLEGATHNFEPCGECETRKGHVQQLHQELLQLRARLDQQAVLAVGAYDVSASPPYLTHLAISVSHVEPGGIGYSNSTPTGIAHLLFFKTCMSAMQSIVPRPVRRLAARASAWRVRGRLHQLVAPLSHQPPQRPAVPHRLHRRARLAAVRQRNARRERYSAPSDSRRSSPVPSARPRAPTPPDRIGTGRRCRMARRP